MLGISVRALHLLFELTGTSFGRHVTRGRLSECRAALPASPKRQVTDIAFAWGSPTCPVSVARSRPPTACHQATCAMSHYAPHPGPVALNGK